MDGHHLPAAVAAGFSLEKRIVKKMQNKTIRFEHHSRYGGENP